MHPDSRYQRRQLARKKQLLSEKKEPAGKVRRKLLTEHIKEIEAEDELREYANH